MTDQVLEILKYALLALLYLFFARVLWAVWSEVRGPRPGHATAATERAAVDPTQPAAAPAPVAAAPQMAHRVRRGTVKRIVVVQPRERKGAGFNVGSELTIGRAPHCTISIPDDAFVSTVHARIFLAEGTSWVEDLGSTNGSFLNGARFQGTQPFVKGDRLQIGATVWEAH
jgi:hypothetical protein